MTSILAAQGVIEIGDCHVVSASEKNGTTFSVDITIFGDRCYKIEMHSKSKLNAEQCKKIFQKHLDVLAILTERYITDKTQSFTFNPSKQSLKKELKELDPEGKPKIKERNLEMKGLGSVLEEKLQRSELKRDAFPDYYPQSQKISTKIRRIERAINLYQLWMNGGGKIPQPNPSLGEILIEREDAHATDSKNGQRLKWWEEEETKLKAQLEILKTKLSESDYEQLVKEIQAVRNEAIEASVSPGWGLGADFTTSLVQDRAKLEAWNRYLSKKQIQDRELYKRHIELLLNRKGEDWESIKSQIIGEFNGFYAQIAEEVHQKIEREDFYKFDKDFFWGLVKTKHSRVADQKEKKKEKEKEEPIPSSLKADEQKELYDFARGHFRQTMQYRGKALLRREESTPGWSLEHAKVHKNDPSFKNKWDQFLQEMHCTNDDHLYQVIIYYGLTKEDKDPTVEKLAEKLVASFKDYLHDIDYTNDQEDAPFKSRDDLKEFIKKIAASLSDHFS